jgi:SAM-dependent methyltransferase
MNGTQDSGERLRSAYASAGGVKAVFSPKVADYSASRPDYPAGLFALLRTRQDPAAGLVADVGAGTGLLTRDLVRAGYRVVAVEPNLEMRQEADRRCVGLEGYSSVEGSAESMPFAAGSIALITAAQAFHWFDVDRSRVEFQRVLGPRGQAALVWNDRVLDDPLHAALDEVFERFGGARRGALVAHEDRSNVPRFFGSRRAEEFSWPHEHRLDEAGLQALVFSRSYMPRRTAPEGQDVSSGVHDIFHRFAAGGSVVVRYRTVAFLGRPS